MKSDYQQFYNNVMEHYGEHGRHDLPWRMNHSAYRVAVSEMMLQQTQVARVIPFFKDWMKKFPSWKALAKAPQSEVLRSWKGLGYNSQALRLQKLAQAISSDYNGRLPQKYHTLIKLPGIGPYTAGAIRAFAFNKWTPLIETNIRRVFIHHFFPGEANISDSQILDIINEIGEIDEPRIWYAALMDYGATLPKIIKHNPNKQSKHYTKQSKFEGSDRQIRGKILELLLKNPKQTKKILFKSLGDENKRYEAICNQMEKEGFIVQTKTECSII